MLRRLSPHINRQRLFEWPVKRVIQQPSGIGLRLDKCCDFHGVTELRGLS
jgi:hypothetical protein